MKTEYLVICDGCLGMLTKRVNGMLERGWKCQGGVSVAIDPAKSTAFSDREFWAQAIIKEYE